MSDLIFEVKNHIACIRLNRPDSLNAFSFEMIEKWIESLEEIKNNDDIYVGILTGNGRAFCAGGDTKAMVAGDGFMSKSSTSDIDFSSSPEKTKDSLWKYIQQIPLLMEQIDKPMIASINGAAIGAGLDMALMCDYRVSSDKAKLGEGYINVGIVPGDGGAYYLPRIIGIDKALELFWTGEIISASEAKGIGMVSRVIEHEKLDDEVLKFAERLVKAPQLALRMTKRAVYQSLTMTLRQSLDMVSSSMAIAIHNKEHESIIEDIKKKQNQKKGKS